MQIFTPLLLTGLSFALPSAGSDRPAAFARSDEHGQRAIARAGLGPGPGPSEFGEDGGPAWAALGPFGGNVVAVAASPTVPGLVLAAVDSFATPLFRSTDGGQSWQAVSTLGSVFATDVDFAADGTAYLGTSFHLRASIDGGVTWSERTNPYNPSVAEIAFEPGTGALWLGLGASSFGETEFVLRSPDGGTTWANLTPPLPSPLDGTALAFEPGVPVTVYAGFSGFPGGGALWVSTNGGTSWTQRSAGLPAAPVRRIVWDGSRALVAGGAEFGSQTFGLFASANDGAAWTPLHDGTWPSLYTFGLDVDPADPSTLLVASARSGVFRSVNGGSSWTFGVAGTAGISFNAVRFAPGGSGLVFAGASSQGAFRSSDGGGGFTASSTGMTAVDVRSVAAHPGDRRRLAVGFSGQNDGGVLASADEGVTWTPEAVPPTRYSWVGYAPDGTLHAISDGPSTVAPEGVYRRESDGTWTPLGPDQGGLFETEGTTLAFGASTPGLILLAGNDFGVAGFQGTIWRTATGGPPWEKVYESAADGVVAALAILADGTDQTMVAAAQTLPDAALRSTNGGVDWSPSATGLPAGTNGFALCALPADPLRLFYASGFAPTGLYTSADGGLAWSPAGSLAADLRGVVCDPTQDGVLYVLQVFPNQILLSPDGGQLFLPYSSGLLNAPFNALAGAADPTRLLLASGAGAWRRHTPLFLDGFESGDTAGWSATVGP